MMKLKKMRRAVALWLLVCMCLSMAACGKQPADTTGAPAGKTTYTIEVKNQSGAPLEGVGVYIYTDSAAGEFVWFAKTDGEGVMTFTQDTSDQYVAVLENVPEGYAAEASYPLTGETTRIVLEGSAEPGDLTAITYQLGDLMLDFTVTAVDGTGYTLSELLAVKDAVVLNFWFMNCQPCKNEFPYLQQAFERFGDRIAVLGMNPVDSDEAAIAQFGSDLGLTFPLAACDPAWESAMKLTGYPTTVVIDRTGTISLIHTGSVTDAQTFLNIFAYFADENYQPGTVDDINSLPQYDIGVDPTDPGDDPVINNPTEVSGVSSFELTVKPGEVVSCTLRKISNMILKINDGDAYVIYNGKTYRPTSGVVSLTISSEDPSLPVEIQVGNTGNEIKTFTIKLNLPEGSLGNPYTLKLGEFTVNVAAGNDQGVFYDYHATESGTLTVQCLSVTPGVDYDYALYNLNTYSYRNLASDAVKDPTTGVVTVSVKVNKGDTVRFSAAAMPDSSNNYPKATFKFLATFTKGTGSDDNQSKTLTYSVKITDGSGKAISGVTVYISQGSTTETLVTDSSGVASAVLTAGTYTATVKIPSGYEAETTKYQLTQTSPSVTVKLNKIVMKTYTVKAVDTSGNPVKDVLVTIGSSYGYTDASGSVSFSLKEGSYSAQIEPPNGYTADKSTYSFGTATTLTVTLTKGSTSSEKITYTVKVVDYFGNAVTGVEVKFGTSATQKVNSSGVATASLTPGSYMVTLSGSYYYDTAAAKLTATTTSITIKVASRVGTQTESLYICDNPVPSLSLGSTYVELGSSQKNFVTRGGSDYCFFVFVTNCSGYYQISVDNSAEISFWGASTAFIPNSPYETGSSSKPISLTITDDNVSNGQVSQTNILAVKVSGSLTGCVLTITRTGDIQLSDEEKAEWIVYEPKTPPTQYTLSSGGDKLQPVDLTASTDTYKLVLGSDKYYHLGSASGPIMYVNMKASRLSFYEFLGKTGLGGSNLRRVFYDDNGKFLKKEDYTSCLSDYVDARDTTYHVYPLTEDLMYMIQNGGIYRGWWDSTNPNYLFDDVSGLNVEIAWMFACCYIP